MTITVRQQSDFRYGQAFVCKGSPKSRTTRHLLRLAQFSIRTAVQSHGQHCADSVHSFTGNITRLCRLLLLPVSPISLIEDASVNPGFPSRSDSFRFANSLLIPDNLCSPALHRCSQARSSVDDIPWPEVSPRSGDRGHNGMYSFHHSSNIPYKNRLIWL